ncbi:peptidoglycan DD-metalloendopeptidase family protein [Brevibacillus sp. NPDC058079]|uniref:peptidoglycan DD-metalloendopeptidase family protein n=1 Tax=Brevibacillus sp. NPDC058079 TaxID=3346330 RepID=UPI0036E5CBCB
MNYNGNEHDNPMGDVAKDVGDKAADVGKKGAKMLAKKAGSMVKKAVVAAAKKAAAALGKAILSALAAVAPYVGIALLILFVIVAGWYILFESRGAESNYSMGREAENKTSYNDKGYFSTSEMSGKNKAIVEFYNYFGTRAYRQIIGEDNTKLEKPEDTEVRDYYKQEKLFSINPNFLFVLDEFIFKGEFRYPEQFVKPVHYDPDKLSLKQLIDEKGNVVAESVKYDPKTGLKTEEKEKSVHDYGVGSIFKYKEDEVLRTVEGFYTQKEVYDKGCDCVRTDSIKEPFNEIMHEYPQKIWLIDKAITFAMDVKLAYEKQKVAIEGLKNGKTNDPKTDLIKVWYMDYDVYKTVCNKNGCYEVFVKTVPLYKYREGYVYETKPVPVPHKNEETKYGLKYVKDYMYFFNTWVPESVMKEFDFHARTGQIINTDLDVGSKLDSENFRRALQYLDIIQQYAEDYGVDPYIIVALISQESGGNPNVEDGLMQIVGDGYRAVTAKNVRTGQTDTFAVNSEEDRRDPETAIHWGIMYFANKLSRFDGDNLKALQSYNVDVSGYIMEHYPEAWATTDWMNYREEARLYYGQKEGYGVTRSASYDCAPDIAKESGTIYGDVCYIEHVLRYYAGDAMDGLEGHDKDTPDNGVVDFFKQLFGIKQKEYAEDEKRSNFEHHMGQMEVDWTIKSATTFDKKILFSEVGNTEEMNFWDDGFSTTNGNLTAEQFSSMVPGSDGYISPLNLPNVRVSSGFGSRIDPVTHQKGAFHKGVDVAVPIGTPLYAIADGTVEAAGPASGFGLWVVIRLDDGAKTVYGHIDSYTVKVGDKVKQGKLVAFSGNRGKSTGPHLHFEYYLNGKPIDPYHIVMRKAK